MFQSLSKTVNRLCKTIVPVFVLSLIHSTAYAADESSLSVGVMGLVICAALVFFMQAGFALLESGMVRSKNSLRKLDPIRAIL